MQERGLCLPGGEVAWGRHTRSMPWKKRKAASSPGGQRATAAVSALLTGSARSFMRKIEPRRWYSL